MALRGTRTVALTLLALLAIGLSAGPAVAETIVVTPAAARPGQRVHISVPGCSTGPTAHTAASAAFTGDVRLHGKADTGDADIVLKAGLKPGAYPIVAHCGATTVLGRIAIASDNAGGGGRTNYWLLAIPALALAAIAGVFVLLRRRDRP
ncbi:hypothetical protein [Actinomadura sp. DC4]|uniref:hypothetical protein n=1 Tax=Actinomadura sp. DC4 TaxID=3055069 RepID=UPI0025B0B866|nr:hypothetical protein [Actinomadura sp. DC4]MDN3354012.1 hypothetical protein [Actinomadura sp. DC4]